MNLLVDSGLHLLVGRCTGQNSVQSGPVEGDVNRGLDLGRLDWARLDLARLDLALETGLETRLLRCSLQPVLQARSELGLKVRWQPHLISELVRQAVERRPENHLCITFRFVRLRYRRCSRRWDSGIRACRPCGPCGPCRWAACRSPGRARQRRQQRREVQLPVLRRQIRDLRQLGARQALDLQSLLQRLLQGEARRSLRHHSGPLLHERALRALNEGRHRRRADRARTQIATQIASTSEHGGRQVVGARVVKTSSRVGCSRIRHVRL